MNITIKADDRQSGKITVASPFNPDFAPKARGAGGRWDAARKVWVFDARDEERVRKICRTVYGTDGADAADVLTIRATAKVCDQRGQGKFDDRPMSYWLAGREIARAYGRDSGAKLADGVVLLTGGFYSGGSVKNPACYHKAGTTFEVRDVPRAAAEKVHAEYHDVTLLDASGNIVAEPTSEPAPEPQAETAPDRSAELAAVQIEIAAAEGRLAGLRYRAAEIGSAAA
jgi:hypothetical protein